MILSKSVGSGNEEKVVGRISYPGGHRCDGSAISLLQRSLCGELGYKHRNSPGRRDLNSSDLEGHVLVCAGGAVVRGYRSSSGSDNDGHCSIIRGSSLVVGSVEQERILHLRSDFDNQKQKSHTDARLVRLVGERVDGRKVNKGGDRAALVVQSSTSGKGSKVEWVRVISGISVVSSEREGSAHFTLINSDVLRESIWRGLVI